MCLPAEELSLAGFAQNGQADTMAPGPLLATVLDAVMGEDGSGLAGLADDQLIGVLSGARRMEARAAWAQLAAMRELARRRPAQEPGDTGRAGLSDFAADELMGEFHLTWDAATAQIAYACTVADRLPRTFAALAAGQIHPVAVKIIEDETRYLSPKHAAKADQVLADLAQSKSFARLRYAAHRLVLKLDPDYAQRRKDEVAPAAPTGPMAPATWAVPAGATAPATRAVPGGATAPAGATIPSPRPATRAGPAAAPVTTPSQASRRRSRSPCRSRRCKACPRPPARSARSAWWTPPTPATWPPPRPGTRAPGGASPP